jgi:hypothetical protein
VRACVCVVRVYGVFARMVLMSIFVCVFTAINRVYERHGAGQLDCEGYGDPREPDPRALDGAAGELRSRYQ